MFKFFVADYAPLIKADQEHAARLQPALFLDAFGREFQHAGLGRHDELVVVGHGIAERTQSVAVQDGADILAVGRQHHGWAVPRFHHAGMELVEVLLFLRHGFVLIPCFGDHHQHGVGQLAPGHYQQFQGVVEAGRVAGHGVADGRQLVDVVAVERGAELLLAGVHPVDVSAQRVDLAVVGEVAVRMGQLPVSQRVGAKTRMHQRERRDHRFVVQVQIEAGELIRNQQPFIDHGVATQATHVEEVGVVFSDAGLSYGIGNDFANDVKLAFKGRSIRGVRRAFAHEELPDGRTDGEGVAPNLGMIQGNVAPAQKGQALVGDDVLDMRGAG